MLPKQILKLNISDLIEMYFLILQLFFFSSLQERLLQCAFDVFEIMVNDRLLKRQYSESINVK